MKISLTKNLTQLNPQCSPAEEPSNTIGLCAHSFLSWLHFPVFLGKPCVISERCFSPKNRLPLTASNNT